MSLSITVLGCSGTFADAGRACSGYLVQSEHTTVWLDAGPGTLAALAEHVDPRALDAIVISHAHWDHWTDLLVARNAFRYIWEQPGPPIYGPQDVRAIMRAAVPDVDETFSWTTTADGFGTEIGDLDVSFSRTDHPGITLAARFESGGRSIGYSADTGEGWSMGAFGRRVDLAVWEATFAGEPPDGALHTSGAGAGRLAAEAGVGMLVVTHAVPGEDPERIRAEAEATFGAPVESAVGGRTYEA